MEVKDVNGPSLKSNQEGFRVNSSHPADTHLNHLPTELPGLVLLKTELFFYYIQLNYHSFDRISKPFCNENQSFSCCRTINRRVTKLNVECYRAVELPYYIDFYLALVRGSE